MIHLIHDDPSRIEISGSQFLMGIQKLCLPKWGGLIVFELACSSEKFTHTLGILPRAN